MVIFGEVQVAVENLVRRIDALESFVQVENKKKMIVELEQQMSGVNFWENPERGKNVTQQIRSLRAVIEPVLVLKARIYDLHSLLGLVEEKKDDDPLLVEVDGEIKDIFPLVDKLEIASFLSGKHDHCNAILSIHAGAGGTESCDWADMLLRMYLRWVERRGFSADIQDVQPGEETGLSRVTVRIAGPNAYGYAKAERGVHRLVRISPFDANKRRHTSFCSVDVIAEIDGDEDEKITIRDEEIRIDTYRSSGKGGQHVNKTESAIRITHLPTGIVVTCQNERSQYKNKEIALKTLRSRLYEKMEDEKRNEMEKFYGEKGEMGWGNQIRSYVLQPYQMVKDLRTGAESSNVQEVMDGDIDFFINAWLRAGCPKARKQNVNNN
ncbi:MAG: peptide chain release factor 2 [Puniceicoccales bacterium]|nr:peptide chain release factor 2 [Puniceicoccales bacterium]